MSENTTQPQVEGTGQNDIMKRAQAFNEKLLPLLDEYKIGLGAQVFITPDGRLGARPTLFDDTKAKEAAVEGGTEPAKKPEEQGKEGQPASGLSAA